MPPPHSLPSWSKHEARPQSTPIIYTSPSNDVFILDIPHSISCAQLLPRSCLSPNPHRKIISTPALQEPYGSTEPKSAAKRAKLKAQMGKDECASDAEYATLLQAGRDDARKAGVGVFCYERVLVVEAGEDKGRRKRKRGFAPVDDLDGQLRHTSDKHTGSETLIGTREDVSAFLRRLADDGTTSHVRWRLEREYPRVAPSSPTASFENTAQSSRMRPNDSVAQKAGTGSIVHNPGTTPMLLSTTTPGSTQRQTQFYIPACSLALNSPIGPTPEALTKLLTFSSASNSQAAATASRATPMASTTGFKLVLLDPPWPNRSARRQSSYANLPTPSHSGESLAEIKATLLSLDVPQHLTADGYIAVWVTHKPSVRRTVEELFGEWGVGMCEEWVWGKITEGGEWVNGDGEGRPGGLWRRAWEVLMIGRRMGENDSRLTDGLQSLEPGTTCMITQAEREMVRVKRRVILAVPDLHSRKPCLKALFEKLLLGTAGTYTAKVGPTLEATTPDDVQAITELDRPAPVLELFARHMVAGWCSWGDEALRYQWKGCWAEYDSG